MHTYTYTCTYKLEIGAVGDCSSEAKSSKERKDWRGKEKEKIAFKQYLTVLWCP